MRIGNPLPKAFSRCVKGHFCHQVNVVHEDGRQSVSNDSGIDEECMYMPTRKIFNDSILNE